MGTSYPSRLNFVSLNPIIPNIYVCYINLFLNFCFFKSTCNFFESSCDSANWSVLVRRIVLKLSILLFKLKIILSFKTIFCSKSFIFSPTKFNSFLAPSPVIKSLITNFAIGFFN